LPEAGAQDDRDNLRLAALVALERSLQFDAITVLGIDEIGAD
jgi:hypothetical protein